MNPRRTHEAATLTALAVGATIAAGAYACGGDDPASTADAAAPAASSSPEAAAIAAWDGETVLGVPAYPEAEPASGLRERMRDAWLEEGEPEAMFDVRMGERMLVTDDPLPLVREFYLPFVHRVFMDHEMEFPDVGTQEMFTGLMVAPDGTLVKFTATRPFFRYPDQAPVDRTVIQVGRVGQQR